MKIPQHIEAHVDTLFPHRIAVMHEVVRRRDVGFAGGKADAVDRVVGPHLDWRVNWFNERLDAELLVPPMSKAVSSNE